MSATFVSTGIFAQVVNIVKNDGSTQQFDLADVASMTVGVVDSNASGEGFLRVHGAAGISQLFVEEIDSLYFNTDGTVAYFQTARSLSEFTLADVDSMTFSDVMDSTVYVNYAGSAATVINPMAPLGVSVSVSGADVTVDAAADISNLNYRLSGNSGDGMFKIYSDKKLNLYLDGVQITNPDGPAINIQSSKKMSVFLKTGTTSVLTDGETYATPPNDEDQKGAFFSEGQLIFAGSGALQINGVGSDEHGLVSDDYIEVNEGAITVLSAVKDGVHVNDGFFMNGGSLNINSDGDGIDGGAGPVEILGGNIVVLNGENDNDAIKCDSTILIAGGTVDLTVAGDQSKGINSDQDVVIAGGMLTISTSGNVVLEPDGSGFDPSYCTAIKAGTDVSISAATVILSTVGEAGRGISGDGNFSMSSGILSINSTGDGAAYTNADGDLDAYHGPCIKMDGNIDIAGGEITLNHSGDGGKALTNDLEMRFGTATNAPVINITTSGQNIVITGGRDPETAEAKAISADSAIVITSGTFNISSADDGIKSKAAITVNGGNINITNSYEGIEAPFITFTAGEVHVLASDDALNATFGVGGEQDDGSLLAMNGGYVVVSSSGGDGIDSNGRLHINGGTIVVHGPPSSPEVGVDVNGAFLVNGGFMVVSGTNSNMTEIPSQSSGQYSLLMRTSTSLNAGALFHLEDAAGNELVTFAPERRYYSITFSSAALSNGTTYRIYTGGSYSGGTEADGVYSGGTYSGGTLRTSFTLSSVAQTVNF